MDDIKKADTDTDTHTHTHACTHIRSSIKIITQHAMKYRTCIRLCFLDLVTETVT